MRAPKLEELRALRNERVGVRGRAFELGGRAFEPRGINSYPLLQLLGDGRSEAVRDVFAQALALKRPIVRTNAFLDEGENPARLRDGRGALREQGMLHLDRLLALARADGVRLLLVLTNNWRDYGGAEAVLRFATAPDVLPKDAFYREPRAIEAQCAFIRALVGRRNTETGVPYALDPTVFAWELANEARCTDCDWCRPDTLVRWARVMANEVRAAGALQPIAWGGSGYVRRYGEDLDAIAADGALDILTMHVYPRVWPVLAKTMSAQARIDWAVLLGAARLYGGARIARHHDMPLLIEELGYLPPEHAEDRDGERAAVIGRLLALAAQLELPVLPWMIGEVGRRDHDGHLLRAFDDAAWAAVRA